MARKKVKDAYGIVYKTIQKQDAVTGSMHIVETCGLKIVLDMGIYQDNSFNMVDKYKLNAHNLRYEYNDIDYVILTHLHSDHVGAVPVLGREDIDFNGKILATELTAHMAILNNTDSAFLMKSECDAWNRLHPKEKVAPLYNQEDVDRLQIREYDYHTKIRLNDKVYLTFLPNSHCCGSASAYITVEEDGKIMNSLLYTSDIQYTKKGNRPFTKKWDAGSLIVHNLVIESTYGNTVQEEYNAIDELEKMVLNSIRNNRPLLIGTFAFHRSSVLAYYLYKIWERNEEIREANYPIYMAGNLMHKAHKELGSKRSELFFDEEWKNTGLWQWNKPIWLTQFKDVETRLSNPTTCLVIATSGMLDKAYSKFLCTRWLGKKNVDIAVSGYASPDTVAGQLLAGSKEILIDGKMYRVRCGFLGKMVLSGHADKNSLCNFIKDCVDKKYLKNIFLVHGDYERKLGQMKLIQNIVGEKVEVTIPKRYSSYKC